MPFDTDTYKGYTIGLYVDEYAPNPRKDYDHLTTMYCSHRRYELGDIQVTEPVKCKYSLPLYLYDHGGITMSTTEFSCGWDSGQVGIICANIELIKQEFGWKRITAHRKEWIMEMLRNDVKEYNAYISGMYCGFVVTDEDDEHIDSCWGFQSGEAAMQSARETVNWLLEESNHEN